MPVMSKALKVRLLKQRFKKLNPAADTQEIDWEAVAGNRETFNETLIDLKGEYPMYHWDKMNLPKSNDDAATRAMRADLEQSGYKVIKRGEYRHLVRAHNRVNPKGRHGKGMVVPVKAHWRRNPRR
jgi:hypothetical protein